METAAWWRKHSLESAVPDECLWYAENQELLANHMRENALIYAHTGQLTDWQTYQRLTAARS
jgi:hypothetical protein